MFDLRWGQPQALQAERRLEPVLSRLSAADVSRTLHLVWEEHCVECAVPECYRACPLYVARGDGQCARFSYGIVPNPDFAGRFALGADIRFRRWGKLEAGLGVTSLAVPRLTHGVESTFAHLPLWLRNRLARVAHAMLPSPFDFDAFVLECVSDSPDPFRLILSYTRYDASDAPTVFRHSFEIVPGPNFFTIPFERFQLLPAGFVSVAPEEAAGERRLVFTWLDFVKFRPGRGPVTSVTPVPAAKVKCVAWDLDETLWNGTLAETEDAAALVLKDGVAEALRQLDERGVIQTIVSRNDHAAAWTQLERLGVADYFVYPAINWGQKSSNLREVARRININLDTFAFIDDAPLQRSEIQAALPQVRVYSDRDVMTLIDRPEFALPVTAASRSRRRSYLASMRRDDVQATFDGSYDDFLRSCEMQLRIFRPRTADEITRCWELMQRTNQLNLSGRRYPLDEFSRRLGDDAILACAIHYRDRFGDYGIVAFATIADDGTEPLVTDFVMSCRVAQQRVEQLFIDWLATRFGAMGRAALRATVTKTPRNGPMQQAFVALPFDAIREAADVIELRLPLDRATGVPPLAQITADAM